MPVRICIMCRHHLDSTDDLIFCGCDDIIKKMSILKGSTPLKDFIFTCPLLVKKKTEIIHHS